MIVGSLRLTPHLSFSEQLGGLKTGFAFELYKCNKVSSKYIMNKKKDNSEIIAEICESEEIIELDKERLKELNNKFWDDEDGGESG